MTSTLDRHSFSRPANPSIPSRSLSSQHISTGLSSSTRSPSMRRMRHLLELEQSRLGVIPNPSPVPTPSSTLPRSGQRQIDINPAGKLGHPRPARNDTPPNTRHTDTRGRERPDSLPPPRS